MTDGFRRDSWRLKDSTVIRLRRWPPTFNAVLNPAPTPPLHNAYQDGQYTWHEILIRI